MNYANYNEYSDDRTTIALSGKPFYAATMGILAGAPIAAGLYKQYGHDAYTKYGSKWAGDTDSFMGYKNKLGGMWKSAETAAGRTGGQKFWKNLKGNARGLWGDFLNTGPGMIGKHADKGRRFGLGRVADYLDVGMRNAKIDGMDYAARRVAKGSSKYLAPGLGTFFGIASMTQGIQDEGNLFGAYVGLGSEIGATVGARAGSVIGSTIGLAFGGVGAPVGGAVGMLAGGYIGYQAAPTMMNIARAVRRFGTPETGGVFRDNQQTQTMRQRSMLAIRTSQHNLRSELGRESQMLMGALY